MPRPTKTIAVPGNTNRNPHASVGRDALEDDVEGGEVERVTGGLWGFDYGYEEDGEGDPPEVVGELAMELLAEKVAAGPGHWCFGWSVRCGGIRLLGELPLEGIKDACRCRV